MLGFVGLMVPLDWVAVLRVRFPCSEDGRALNLPCVSRLFAVCEAEITIFIPPPESVMDISWAANTWRTKYSIRIGCSLHDNYLQPRSIPVLIALNISCPLNDYFIGEDPLQIFSSYSHTCFSGTPCTVMIAFPLLRTLPHGTPFFIS